MAEQPIASTSGKPEVLLLVDDDKAFLQRLARAMEKRGFVTETAESVAEARVKMEQCDPDFAVVDMRLEDGNGL
ncbi:MAG TPA: response regulator, partial [Afifellaceae bacterium]|nr:response regulator [Afifellaceae bacterium]